jgi:predicted phage tail protein
MINPGNSQEQKEMDAVPEQLPEEEQQQPTNEENEQVVTGEKQDVAGDVASAEVPVRRGKKRIKKYREVTEAELMPRPSIWPLALAVSVAVALGGFAFNLIILGVGVIMIIVSVVGWNLERR